jgi:hypothetical protein
MTNRRTTCERLNNEPAANLQTAERRRLTPPERFKNERGLKKIPRKK